MAKLILLLVFVCFQFSSQEELTDVATPSEIPEMLDGEDENQWHRDLEENWLDELLESDEDYDDDRFEKIEKLIDEIEVWIGKSHPERDNYQWLFDIEKWFEYDFGDDDDYADYPELKKEENSKKRHIYFDWPMLRMNAQDSRVKRARPFKRFWSV